jgi:hypothetical protein
VVARVPTVPLNQRQGFSLKRTLDSAVATVAASSYSGAGQSIAHLGVTERSVLLVSEGLDGEQPGGPVGGIAAGDEADHEADGECRY